MPDAEQSLEYQEVKNESNQLAQIVNNLAIMLDEIQ